MINNINYNGQFSLPVTNKLHDKLDKIKKENSKSGTQGFKICEDRRVLLDIGLLDIFLTKNIDNATESFMIEYSIILIKRILSTDLHYIEDTEISKDYMVTLLHKLERMVE